jgi:transcription elongation factor Elf1
MNDREVDLIAVHQCERCGLSSSPSQTNDDANVTGIVVCPKCGHTGPLRILIVKLGDTSLT